MEPASDARRRVSLIHVAMLVSIGLSMRMVGSEVVALPGLMLVSMRAPISQVVMFFAAGLAATLSATPTREAWGTIVRGAEGG